MKNPLNLLILCFLILNIMPILAPILRYLGADTPANAIYFVYSFFCHQFDWRSIHIHDYQVAWCVRDTFIWFGVLITTIAIKFKYLNPQIKWYFLFLLMLPIVLDGGIQTFSTILKTINSESDFLYISNSPTRMITGSLFGIGFGILIARILDVQDNEKV